jgi:hypothetical protein
VQRLKGRLSKKKPKTVNDVLTVLNKLLKVAVEWKVVAARLPRRGRCAGRVRGWGDGRPRARANP